MSDLTHSLGAALETFFASQAVQLVLLVAGFCLVTVWLAAAFWAFRDMHDRTENPVLPYLAGALVVFGNVLGIVVYRIIRPPERLGDVYERNLAQEALLAEVEAVATCRSCDRRVDEEWLICPWCRTRLKRICPNCERLVGLDWTLCAWCGKEFETPAAAVAPAGTAAPAVGDASATPALPAAPRAISASTASGEIAPSKPAVGP
jgi:RNA polymerase subunit RPABC4/transcription elongation factor Spt4